MEHCLFDASRLNGAGKKILVRIDMNGGEAEGYKTKRYAKELRNYLEWVKQGHSVVLATHYGRRGDPDFREELRFLAQALEDASGVRVHYIDSLMDGRIKAAVSTPGIYLIRNLRATELERTGGANELCDFFREHFDVFVNDAPAVCHRGHTSVLMPLYMEGYAGNVLLEEVRRLDEIRRASKKILVWGGSKMGKVKYVQKLLDKEWTVLLGGLPAVKYIEAKNGEENEISRLFGYGDRLVGPVDFVEDGGRVVDIGPKTQLLYSQILEDAGGGVFSGPVGVYEEGYEESSVRLMKLCTAILGGHSGNIAYKHGLEGILTSGGAALAYLAEDALPGIDALMEGGGGR